MSGVGFALFARFIGNGKMGEDAFCIQSRQGTTFADALHTGIKIIAVAQITEAGHAGVHLDVDLKGTA